MDKNLFIGMDFGTQSMKLCIVNEIGNIVHSLIQVKYDSDLPQYKTVNGVYKNEDGSVTAPSLMFVHALDIAFEKLRQENFAFEKVKAISGSGQQHGCVFWNKNAINQLQKMDPKLTIQQHETLFHLFSMDEGPIWMDSTTKNYCKKLEEVVGGSEKLAKLTGSRAYERFTGSQIAKVVETKSECYYNTERISLISSLIPTILLGKYAAIDYADASGMNLFDIRRKIWIKELLQACGENLETLLGNPVPSHSFLGAISLYFQQRYGFNRNCMIIAWSGDNPCSLAGIGLEQPGEVGVSLGTSDTVFAITRNPVPGLTGHVFISPIDPDSFMCISLARDAIRKKFAKDDWVLFDEMLQATSPGNDGKIGFHILQPEITPDIKSCGTFRYASTGETLTEFDPHVEVRSVIESTFLSMRLHLESIGVNKPTRIVATGGSSVNRSMLQVLSNVFGVTVVVANISESAAFGSAFRAIHGWKCLMDKEFVPFSSVIPSKSLDYSVAASPDYTAHEVYTKMLPNFFHLQYGLMMDM